jgi:antitoxin component YwqK of YwqJK toxin-antitoxin module
MLQRAPGGRLRGANAEIELYREIVVPRFSDGVYTTNLPGGARLETNYRGGRPDGAFRAFYGDGKLWAEATYVSGRPSGSHIVYDHNGKVIYKTVFAP